jgi:hypothetical protein
MDPITTAIATIFFTKALEKTGEKFGEGMMEKVGQVIAKIRKHSPKTAKLLESGDSEVLDIGTAVLEEIPPDPIFAELLEAAEGEENRTFQEKFQAVKAGGMINIIGKQVNVDQGGTGNTQNNTFNL